MRLLTTDNNMLIDTLNAFEVLIPSLVGSALHTDSAALELVNANEVVSMYNIYTHPQLGLIGSHAARATYSDELTLVQAAHVASQQCSLSWLQELAPAAAAAAVFILNVSYNLCCTLAELFATVYLVSLL